MRHCAASKLENIKLVDWSWRCLWCMPEKNQMDLKETLAVVLVDRSLKILAVG